MYEKSIWIKNFSVPDCLNCRVLGGSFTAFDKIFDPLKVKIQICYNWHFWDVTSPALESSSIVLLLWKWKSMIVPDLTDIEPTKNLMTVNLEPEVDGTPSLTG